MKKDRLIKLLKELIAIDSQNPPGNESRIALFVEGYLKRLGLKTRIYEFRKGRSNIIAVLKGKGDKSLLLTPHLDTVPAGRSWTKDPFNGWMDKGSIYGLGSTDCKCNLAVSMEAVNSLVEQGAFLNYNLIIAATADEESGSALGLIPLLDKGILKPDGALVLDADDFKIVVAQKGLLHLKIRIKGKKAHGAYPWLGVNAIDKSIEIISDLKKMDPGIRRNKYLRPPTMNIGTIKGGDKVNVVADWCEFELDFRFLPGTSEKTVLSKVREVLKKYSKTFWLQVEGSQKPYLIKESHGLVKVLSAAMSENKIAPAVEGSEGATVITFFQDKGIPAIATGFGSSGQAHMADERVKIENLYKGAQVMESFLLKYRF